MIAADLISQVLAAGGQIAADGPDLVLTAPRPLPADLLDRLKAHKADILAALAHPDLPGVSPEFAARLSTEDWEDLAAGDISVELVRAFEAAATSREAVTVTAVVGLDPLPPLTPAAEARRQREAWEA